MPLEAEFWSSVEYAGFGHALARELTQCGLAAQHRYQLTQSTYWAARGGMARLKLRAAAYGLYPLRLARHVRRSRQVAVVCTNTFYAPSMARRAAPAHGPVTPWALDLAPDVLVLAGKVRAGSFTERTLRRVVGWTLQHANANVFLGERLRRFAEARFGDSAGHGDSRGGGRDVVSQPGAGGESRPAARPLLRQFRANA